MRPRLLPGLALVAMVIPSVLLGFQAVGGGRGLFRIQDVKSEGYGWLTITEHSFLREVTEKYNADIVGGVAYAPSDWLELMFVSPGYAMVADSIGRTRATHNFKRTWLDTRVGGKLGLTFLPVIKLGVAGYYQFAMRDTFTFSDYPLLKGNYWGGKGLVALNFKDVLPSVPFNIIGNYGYFKGGYLSHDKPALDTVWNSIGVGFEVPTRTFAVFVEGNSDFPKGRNPLDKSAYLHVTPGVRFRFGFGLGIDLGLDFGMSDSVPKQTYIAGLSFASPVGRPAPKPLGTIAGTVVDYRTGAPLSATLNLPDIKMKAYQNRPVPVGDNGAFKLEKVPVGTYVIEVNKDGYQKTTATVAVKNNETTIQDFKLRLIKQYGTITGRISDVKSSGPLTAVVKFPGTDLADITTDPATGVYTLGGVLVGAVPVEVNADGYQPSAATVTVKDNEVTTQNFELRPLKVFGTITGRVLDATSKNPVKALLAFPESTALPSEISDSLTGVYTANMIPVGTIPVTASAPGYLSESHPVVVEDGKVVNVDFTLRPAQEFGSLSGTVMDATNHRPVKAQISFSDPSLSPAMTDSATGFYKVDKIAVGPITATASAPGYLSEIHPVVIEVGKMASADFTLRPAQEFGSVSGSITDVTSNKPVKAQVSFSDPSIPTATTDTTTGFYKADKIPVGVIVAKATADGYVPAQATVTIEANKAVAQNFTLSPATQNGQITGVVTDMKTKAPLKATVYFPGTALASVVSDSVTGLYKTMLPIGPSVVACSLPGYAKQMSPTPVVITKDAPTVYDFRMLKIGTEIVLKASAIHFAFNSAEIQPAGYPALDEWVKLMKDNPYMTAEIQGHTDAVGSVAYNQTLSERRAQSVVSYMVSRGVNQSRLTSIGYGKSRLLVQTQEANEENRRVVFKVTGEKQQ